MGALRSAYMAKAMGSAGSRLATDVGGIIAHRQGVKEKERKSKALEDLMEAVRTLKGETKEVDIQLPSEDPSAYDYPGAPTLAKTETVETDATPEMKINKILSSVIFKELQGDKGAIDTMLSGLRGEVAEGKAGKALTAKQKREDEQAEIAHKRAMALAEIKGTERKEYKKTVPGKAPGSTAKRKDSSSAYRAQLEKLKEPLDDYVNGVDESKKNDIAIEMLALEYMEADALAGRPEKYIKARAMAKKKFNANKQKYLAELKKLQIGEPTKKESKKGFFKLYDKILGGVGSLGSYFSSDSTDEKSKKTSSGGTFTLMKQGE